MTISIAAPVDAFPVVHEAAEALIAAGCRSVSIGPWRRPGEADYLVALVYDGQGKRHGLATPELRNLSMSKQAADLARQLREFQR
jgi:hypothetical protein